MMRTLLIATIAIGFAVSDEPCRAQPPDRTLGPFNLPLSVDGREQKRILTQVREFLWQAFRDKVRAKVTLTTHSYEGEPSTFTYSTETDSSGLWRVHVDITRLLSDRRRPPRSYRTTSSFDAYRLRRLTILSGAKAAMELSESDTKADYYLELLGRDGETLAEL